MIRHTIDDARGTLRRIWHGHVHLWYHPTFRIPLAGLESLTGFDPRRADDVLTWAIDRGIVDSDDVHAPDEAPWALLRTVHDAKWLSDLDRPETIAGLFGADARRVVTAPIVESWRRATMGAIDAVAWLRQAPSRRAAVLYGGFHHAGPDRGGGFCGINDVAVAIATARASGYTGAVTILDLDAHPPDGTGACLAGDDRVTIASIGVASAWTTPERVIDVRLPQGSGDDAYLAALDDLLATLPTGDLAVVLAGADPLAGDRFGALGCTHAGLRERDRRVVRWLGATSALLLPAGGYTRGAWRVFAGAIAEAAGATDEVDPDYDPLLRRTRDVARTLDPSRLGAPEDEGAWITEDDVLGALGAPRERGEPRVLGYYTRQGLEYALEHYGLLGHLRKMGFMQPRVEIAADAMPHRMRVTAVVNGVNETLVEVVVSRRRVADWETLFIEWMTLRDPRAPFTPDRPKLPGQDAPGLGFLDEVVHLLVRMAERLGLAGVSAVPAHYHVAYVARKKFQFEDPELRGRFQAIQEALAGVPLARATALLDGPGLGCEWGENVTWTPGPVVLALDPALAAWIELTEPKARAAAEAWRDRLLPVR